MTTAKINKLFKQNVKNNPKTRHLNQSTAIPLSYQYNIRHHAQIIAPSYHYPQILINYPITQIHPIVENPTVLPLSLPMIALTSQSYPLQIRIPKIITFYQPAPPHTAQATKISASSSPDIFLPSSNPSYPVTTSSGIQRFIALDKVKLDKKYLQYSPIHQQLPQSPLIKDISIINNNDHHLYVYNQ